MTTRLNEMGADHVTAWSKGSITELKNIKTPPNRYGSEALLRLLGCALISMPSLKVIRMSSLLRTIMGIHGMLTRYYTGRFTFNL